MKSVKILFLCLCLLWSSANLAFGKDAGKSDSRAKTPIVQNAFPKVFKPVVNFFRRLFGKRKSQTANSSGPNVTALTLSRTEIVAVCATSDNSCAEPPLIEVLATAVEPEGVTLIYSYTVSGGQIIGEGANVIWDLSGVEPGNYKITAAVDDGCGVCGKTETKEVKVVKCSNCD